MRALFRCDASPSMGAGHAMRCVTIARELANRGWSCEFATGNETPGIVPDILEFGRVVPARLFEETRAHDVVIVDGYHLGIDVERAMHPIADRLVVLDDLPVREHDCDLVVDQTLGRKPRDYENLVPERCEVLAGARYALLRPEFMHWRSAALKRRESQAGRIDRLLLSMGGTDADNATGLILEALGHVTCPNEVVVLMNSAAPHFEAIVHQCRALTTGQRCFRVEADAADVAEVMTRADVAIGAAGTTSWERAALGLPSLLISTADNQLDVASALDAAGAAHNLGRLARDSVGDIGEALGVLLGAPERVAAMSRAASAICDARGVHRVVPWLAGADRNGIGLRSATEDDSETLFDWQQQPSVRRYSRNPVPPTRSEHEAWLAGVLNDADRQLYIIQRGSAPVGMLRLDRRDNQRRSFEVSILVDASESGQGIASAALRAIRRIEPIADIWAFVLSGNEASKRLFSRAGYAAVDTEWSVQRVDAYPLADEGDPP